MNDQLIQEMQEKIDKLQRDLNALRSNGSIPYDVEQAFRTRLRIDSFSQLASSVKTAASETQAVNEGGVATYSVAKPMDGFRQMLSGGTTIYIPYYL